MRFSTNRNGKFFSQRIENQVLQTYRQTQMKLPIAIQCNVKIIRIIMES